MRTILTIFWVLVDHDYLTAEKQGVIAADTGRYIPTYGHGRHYDLNVTNVTLENLNQ